MFCGFVNCIYRILDTWLNEHSTVLLYVPVACHLLVKIVTIIESQANLGAVSLDFLKYFKFRKNLDVYITCKLQVFYIIQIIWTRMREGPSEARWYSQSEHLAKTGYTRALLCLSLWCNEQI